MTGAFCANCGAPADRSSPAPAKQNVELTLLQKYADEIQALGEQLADANPEQAKPLQKELQRKIEIYRKQLQSYQAKSPDPEESRIYESSLYGFLALAKFNSVGFARRAAEKHKSLALAIVAKQQEKGSAKEALALLDQAIAIYDDGRSRFAKATIYWSLKQKENALAELDYVIQHFQENHNTYLLARQLKDEIENPPKKGMCFIATAAYGSALAPEVVCFSYFRDEVLIRSASGRFLIRSYYLFSPPLAWLLRQSSVLRFLARTAFLNPLLYLLKRRL
jgi:tetratricopeptide (TPR) repeat protein